VVNGSVLKPIGSATGTKTTSELDQRCGKGSVLMIIGSATGTKTTSELDRRFIRNSVLIGIGTIPAATSTKAASAGEKLANSAVIVGIGAILGLGVGTL